MSKETELSCKNVFKCKDNAAMKKAFNEKWIGLLALVVYAMAKVGNK